MTRRPCLKGCQIKIGGELFYTDPGSDKAQVANAGAPSPPACQGAQTAARREHPSHPTQARTHFRLDGKREVRMTIRSMLCSIGILAAAALYLGPAEAQISCVWIGEGPFCGRNGRAQCPITHPVASRTRSCAVTGNQVQCCERVGHTTTPAGPKRTKYPGGPCPCPQEPRMEWTMTYCDTAKLAELRARRDPVAQAAYINSCRRQVATGMYCPCRS